MPLITLITDYGTSDHYVGALKGVILGIAPDVHVVDISHEVQPHDIVHGAFLLRQIWPCYAPGTIHLVVVDPGVGTDRRVLLARYDGCYVIVPDNGLLTFVHRDYGPELMHVVENRVFFRPSLSVTFHGRDIMAPVAAHLARGVEPHEFGRVADQLKLLALDYRARESPGVLSGSVIHVDRFGTLVTNIHRKQLSPTGMIQSAWEVRIGGESVGPIRGTFSDVEVGCPVAFFGGSDLLEIAVNQGRAVDRWGTDPSPTVEVRLQGPPRSDEKRL